MTRIMKFLAMSAVVSTSVVAFAQKTPHLAPPGMKAVPKYAQKILGMTQVGNQIHPILGPKIPYKHYEVGIARSVSMAFDNFEYDPAQVATDLVPGENAAYGASCQPGVPRGARWWFGQSYVDGGKYNDMTLAAGSAGAVGKRFGTGWTYPVGTVLVDACLVIGSCENFSTTDPGNWATNTGSRGDLDSWLITYGAVTMPAGWFSTDLDTTDFGGAVTWGLPVDGSGGYYVVPGDFDSGTNTITIGNGQVMLWGTKAGNPSQQIDLQFDDDNADAAWDPTLELYSYDYTSAGTVCPPILGILGTFLYDAPAVITPTAYNVLLGSTAAGTVADVQSINGDTTNANKLKLCKALVPTLTSPKVRVDFDFTSPYLAATAVSMSVNANMTNGGSFAIRGFVADRTGGGFVYGAANQAIADTPILLNGNNGQNFSGNSPQPTLNIHTDGTMRARIEIQQTGLSPVAVPCVAIDYVALTVTP